MALCGGCRPFGETSNGMIVEDASWLDADKLTLLPSILNTAVPCLARFNCSPAGVDPPFRQMRGIGRTSVWLDGDGLAMRRGEQHKFPERRIRENSQLAGCLRVGKHREFAHDLSGRGHAREDVIERRGPDWPR